MATDTAKVPTTSGWKAPSDPASRNYPYNCWWVAALRDELSREMLGRWLLDTHVLMFRKEDGTAVAMENRCPHRGAPLTLGCLKGDTVQCGYHGFTFGSDGKCLDVPSMKSPPGAARVPTYPLIEHGPFVWIYLGDPAVIDDVPPPPLLDWLEDDAFTRIYDHMTMDANYMLLKENVLDLTHFGYVHATTFKIHSWWSEPPKFTADEYTTTFHHYFEKIALPALFADPLGVPHGTEMDRDNHGSFLSPALQVANADFIDPTTRERRGRFRICHGTTPINGESMHYFWSIGRDHGTSPEEMSGLRDITRIAFKEDQDMIEAIQQTWKRDPRGNKAPEISVKMDAGGVNARRIVDKWMARETG